MVLPPTVPLHHWWRVDEHLYASLDILVQRQPIPGSDSEDSSSILDAGSEVRLWSLEDILYKTEIIISLPLYIAIITMPVIQYSTNNSRNAKHCPQHNLVEKLYTLKTLKETRNTLDCDQSNVYSSRVVFSAIS